MRGEEISREGVGKLDYLCKNQHKYKRGQLISLEAHTFWDPATYISFIS